MIMKYSLLFIMFLWIGSFVNAQSLDDFYDKTFEIYTPFCGMSAISKTSDSLGIRDNLNFWGVLNIGTTLSKSKPWGFTFYCGERQIGDLFYLLKNLLNEKNKNKNFTSLYYLSDFGFLPNLRFGLNVIGKDEFVANLGLNHSYYITTGSNSVKSDWLAVGPNIYFDKTITDFLAVRVSTGPMFSYANGAKKDPPKIWEHKFEVFTNFGLFAGFEYLKFSKLDDGLGNEVKMRRYDLKLGIRVRI